MAPCPRPVRVGNPQALPLDTCQRNQENKLSGVKRRTRGNPIHGDPSVTGKSGFWVSSPDPAVQVEKVIVAQDFPT